MSHSGKSTRRRWPGAPARTQNRCDTWHGGWSDVTAPLVFVYSVLIRICILRFGILFLLCGFFCPTSMSGFSATRRDSLPYFGPQSVGQNAGSANRTPLRHSRAGCRIEVFRPGALADPSKVDQSAGSGNLVRHLAGGRGGLMSPFHRGYCIPVFRPVLPAHIR